MALYDFLPGVVLSSILLVIVGLPSRWKTTSRVPFPPGPKPRFMTRNFFDIPTELPLGHLCRVCQAVWCGNYIFLAFS
ncbi:hypothetical protein K438DRAFT_2177053 [Mycena galopus ATCC 62051]|nr:hypothetical protein K438DRAFT_2177053 [Mycena galopus ATCC 62051]